jgi:hypothetical protein
MRIGDSLVADDHDADIEKPLGSAFRVMTYPGGRDHRVFQFDRADQPAEPSTVLYNTQFFTRPLVSIEAPADTLFHPDLYELPPGAATLSIEGPTSNPAAVDFLKLAGGSAAQPRLRNLIPLPPRVNRTGGMYFIASQPAVYKCTTFDRHAGQPDDALTQTVSLTVSGTVKLGDDVVQWQTPTAHPGVPAAPKFERFVTEKAVLTLRNHKDKAVATAGYEHRLDIPVGAAAKAAINPASEQWEIIVGDSAATLRIRLYRVFKKNDFADDTKNDPAFDLVYDSVGSLKNVRSYLDKDVWVPVRDFLIEVKPLPALGNQTAKYDSHVDVPLPLTVAASAIVITPPAGAPRMDTPDDRGKDPNPANKRGQIWRFGPLGKVVEDAAVYKVEVTFGDPATVSQKAGFDLTIEPIIRLTAGGAFEASKGSPLELTINDGTPAFSLDTDNLPAGSAAQLDSPNRKVTITVNDAPAAATKAVITITDSQGKKGQRTVTVK